VVIVKIMLSYNTLVNSYVLSSFLVFVDIRNVIVMMKYFDRITFLISSLSYHPKKSNLFVETCGYIRDLIKV